jgi:hypothetical protein
VQVIIDSASSAVQDTQAESLATCLQLVAGDVLPHFLQILNSQTIALDRLRNVKFKKMCTSLW